MTIKEIAAEKGISYQAIYKRIKGAGISLSSLKDKRTGQLTQEGEQKLRQIFGIESAEESSQPSTEQTAPVVE